jgi:RNA polymerase sigma-70 factor, ECF subfamily
VRDHVRVNGQAGSAAEAVPAHAARPGRPPVPDAVADQAATQADLSAAVVAAQQGDEAAFRSVYRAVQPLLLRYLRGLVGDDAEDVASEAWLQVARDLSTFRGDYEGFRAWAATVARHRAMDHIRRVRRRPSTPLPIEDLSELADDADPASQALETLSTRAAIKLIASLPRDQAEAVLLRAVMQLDTATAARVLGKRAGAVRAAAHRGLRRLAERLQRAEREQSGQTAADDAAKRDAARHE